MRGHIYYNQRNGNYILSLGFKEWAMQALPVVDIRVGGKASQFGVWRFPFFLYESSYKLIIGDFESLV